MDIPVELFAPYGTPHEELQPSFLAGQTPEKVEPGMPKPKWVQPASVALVEILHRLEQQPYHWPVGRTMFQKIAFVATKEGLPTDLQYRRGSYGPFAAKLKPLETRLVNNGLIREERLGQMLAVKTGPTFPDARKAYSQELEQWDSIIEKVVDLFVRMNTTHQAELVSTVLFAAHPTGEASREPLTEQDVVNAVMEWKERRKPPLNEQEVAWTVRNLAALGWLKVKASNDLPLPVED
jgi:uncharacterized protein YwgA